MTPAPVNFTAFVPLTGLLTGLRLKGAGEDTRTSQIVLDTLEKRLCEFIQHREVIVQTLAVLDRCKPRIRDEGDDQS